MTTTDNNTAPIALPQPYAAPYALPPYAYQPQQQQQAKSADWQDKLIVGGVVLLMLGGGYMLYKKFSAAKEQQKVAERGGELEVQQAAALLAELNKWSFATSESKLMAIAGQIKNFAGVAHAYKSLSGGKNLQADLQSKLGDNYPIFLSRVAKSVEGKGYTAQDVYSPVKTGDSVYVPQSVAQYVVTTRRATVYFITADPQSMWTALFVSAIESFIDAGMPVGIFTGKKYKYNKTGPLDVPCVEVQLSLSTQEAINYWKQQSPDFYGKYVKATAKNNMSIAVSRNIAGKVPLRFLVEEAAVQIYPTKEAAMPNLSAAGRNILNKNWLMKPEGMAGLGAALPVAADCYRLDDNGNLHHERCTIDRRSVERVLGAKGKLIKVLLKNGKIYVLKIH